MNMRRVDMMIDRLAELAAGDMPADVELGICREIAIAPFDPAQISVCQLYFLHMGLDRYNPLDDFYRKGNLWVGRRGQRRRALCYKLMIQLLASTGGGYRRKYA